MRFMILVLAAAALGGCSTFRPAEPPVCDGRHRRPANLYGSVLDPPPVVAEPVVELETTDPVLSVPSDGGCA